MADKDIEREENASDVQEVEVESTDIGVQSLTDALKKSFVVLKVIMVFVVALFVFSGFFRVQYDEQALVLHYGAIRGDDSGERILTSGLHYAYPKPVDEIVRIPVTKRQVLEVKSFWYFQTPQEEMEGKSGRVGPQLDPLRDGYCITRGESSIGSGADYGILHAKWNLVYTISDIELFFSNIYYRAPKPGEDFYDVVEEDVTPLLKVLIEDAVVTTMVNYSIDDAISNRSAIAGEVRRRLQDKFDKIKSGITIDAVQITALTWPRQVDLEFEAASKASQESRILVTEAEGYAKNLLNEVGGENAEEILAKLKDAQLSEEDKDVLFSRLSGTAQARISQASTYRTGVVETARSMAEYLEKLLPEFEKRPELILAKIHHDAIEEILSSADEKFFAQSGEGSQLRILLNRNPEIRKEAIKKKAAEKNASKKK